MQVLQCHSHKRVVGWTDVVKDAREALEHGLVSVGLQVRAARLQCTHCGLLELAQEIRVLDMKASPYDLADLGYTPIRVETPEGRAEHATAQRGFAERSAVRRTALIDALESALLQDIDRSSPH